MCGRHSLGQTREREGEMCVFSAANSAQPNEGGWVVRRMGTSRERVGMGMVCGGAPYTSTTGPSKTAQDRHIGLNVSAAQRRLRVPQKT